MTRRHDQHRTRGGFANLQSLLSRARTLERAIVAATGAIAAATVATVGTRALAMRDDGTVMHAASVGLFFGVLTPAFAAGLLGRLAVHGSVWPWWLPADGRRAAHLVVEHLTHVGSHRGTCSDHSRCETCSSPSYAVTSIATS